MRDVRRLAIVVKSGEPYLTWARTLAGPDTEATDIADQMRHQRVDEEPESLLKIAIVHTNNPMAISGNPIRPQRSG
jgi:hypothetical protein